MNPLPVGSRKLARRGVRLDDGSVLPSTVLPWFDADGKVAYLMVVMRDSSLAALLPWSPSLVYACAGPIRLHTQYGAFRPFSVDQAAKLAGLWHYDQAWILKQDRWTGDPAVGALVQSNCAGVEALKGLYFRRDLSRISLAVFVRAGGAEFKTWNRRFLASPTPPPPRRPAKVRRAGWILDPIW